MFRISTEKLTRPLSVVSQTKERLRAQHGSDAVSDAFDGESRASRVLNGLGRRSAVDGLEDGARRPTYIKLDHRALSANVQRIREQVGPERQICAVVKSRAYGHGAVEVARVALEAGADRLAVATVSEGLELRKAGITAPIQVLGALGPGEAEGVVRNGLTATLTNMRTAKAIAAEAKRQGKRTPVHIKVNTGMNRLGFPPDEVPGVLRRFAAGGVLPLSARKQWLDVEGIFTHLHSSQNDPGVTREQIATFSKLLERLEREGLRPRLAHADNSWGTHLYPEAHFDMVRPGKALYGMSGDAEPVLSWHSSVTHIQKVRADETVGYGGEFRPSADSRIAVLPVGWSDGAGGIQHVLIDGNKAPVVSVAMDQMMVDVTGIRSGLGRKVRVDDPAVLLGEQKGNRITLEEVKDATGLKNLSEVTTRISPRSPSRTAHEVSVPQLSEET